MTFMPRDADLARQMVGNLFVRGVPDKLSAEYKIRVRMVNAAGVTDGLGPVGMMMLLRDFRLDKVEAAAPKKVSAWRGINPGTEVTHLGRAAVFKQATSDNAVLIQYHGHRAATEVPGEEVSLADEIVEGVPNEVLRDYCLTLSKVGVGYYPRSSFVHVDVRSKAVYWVDWSRPGEPPLYLPPGETPEKYDAGVSSAVSPAGL